MPKTRPCSSPPTAKCLLVLGPRPWPALQGAQSPSRQRTRTARRKSCRAPRAPASTRTALPRAPLQSWTRTCQNRGQRRARPRPQQQAATKRPSPKPSRVAVRRRPERLCLSWACGRSRGSPGSPSRSPRTSSSSSPSLTSSRALPRTPTSSSGRPRSRTCPSKCTRQQLRSSRCQRSPWPWPPSRHLGRR